MKRKVRKVRRPKRIQLAYLGLIVALWNELESQLKSALIALTPEKLTASFLVMNLQIGPLINATRLMAREMQWMQDRANATLRRKRGRYKFFEPFAEHVEHFLTGVDILREHRNYYVHNAISKNLIELQIYKISTRGRVSLTVHPIGELDLENLAFQISDYLTYGVGLTEALNKNASTNFSERPSWPKKPPLPEKLKMPHLTLQDALHPPLSFPELTEAEARRRVRRLEKDTREKK